MANGKTSLKAQLTQRAKLISLTIILTSNLLLTVPAVKAQGVAIGLGVGLGVSLLSGLANRNRYQSTSYSFGISNGSRRQKNSAINVYNKGVVAFNKGDYETAQRMLSGALELDEKMGDAHALLAVCLSKTGKFDEALGQFETAEACGSKQDAMGYERGVCAFACKNYGLAESSLERYIAKGRSEATREVAKRELSIVQHDFVQQSGGNYLSDACSGGVRRWNTNGEPLRVYIDDKSPVPGYRPEMRNALTESFIDWSTGTHGKVKFLFTDKVSDAQITCSWTNNLADLGEGKELGVTQLTYSDGNIMEASIKLLVLEPTKESLSNPLARAKCVDLHEIGHALGMQHSSCEFDTMYFQAPPTGFEFPLTQRDLNTVVALYEKPLNSPATASQTQTATKADTK